ncbi:hypothetical protein J5U18_11920 [Sphingobacteriaceae bacterium WQ 2009]|uniref:BadF-type ATPase n=1 Tax=Rhinopithecimicrobium faecis TaxID=2820698 RepID=A0A8T4HBE6_9SPHI|nr:hypothetical protein [Sphingobacteriaceae bacterium WQ 2009]
MIAVVYSGSRFADWRLADKGRVVSGFRTAGINPYLQDERSIQQLLNKCTNLINNAEQIKRIYFFGAGSSSKERQDKIIQVFDRFFIHAKTKVEHDVIASAIATFGDEKGLIGIIGSGANAAYYNGKRVQKSNFGLGYILADEGSTNWLGRRLLKFYLSETLPIELRDKFTAKFNVDKKIILERVYNSSNPTAFLNSFADFIFENRLHPFFDTLIKSSLSLYFETYMLPLAEANPGAVINFTGSVAASYEAELRDIAKQHGLEINLVVGLPIHNLIKYYINKN